ncbi:E1-E2 ATPase-domain-containing protein [Xylaria venustula]|nr:E1-E2 ATPase-domain-containing protein [Xylaria venustula]
MGADCCGGKKPLPPAKAVQDSCEDSPAAECRQSNDCCTPNNEKCNEGCIQSVADTLCAKGVGDHTRGHHGCGANGSSDTPHESACEAHLKMAFEQYQSFLDSVRCICRSMIDRGFTSCCKPSEADAKAQMQSAVSSDVKTCQTDGKGCRQPSDKPTASGKAACCSTDGSKGQHQFYSGDQKPGNSQDEQPDDCCKSEKLTNDCCNSKTQPQDTFTDCCGTKQQTGNGCNNEIRDHGICGVYGSSKTSSCLTDDGPTVGCRDACYEDNSRRLQGPCCSQGNKPQLAKPQTQERSKVEDVNNNDDTAIRVSVSGMTCNGCSESLTRSLAANGARNIRVNYLQCQAEFTIGPTLDLESILVKTQEETGFRIINISGDDAITVTSSSEVSKALIQMDFDGVKAVVRLDKRTVRIQHDPAIIGARELLCKIRSKYSSVELIDLQNEQQFALGPKQFRILRAQTVASFLFTIPILVLAWGQTHVEERTKAIISLALGSLVQLLAVRMFYQPALQSLIRYHVLELDMLVVIAVTAAYIYSIIAFGYLVSGTPLETASFFETSSLLISLIMLGRLVTSYTRIRAVDSVSFRSLQVGKATLVENGVDHVIDSRLLQFGDIFKVAPGSHIPTDGTIISGVSEVNESMITGETLPILKGPGAFLLAGTINGPGTLVVQLTRLPSGNTITDIAKLVEDASSSKPRVQEATDKVAAWFLYTVLIVAVAVFVIWTVIGIKVLHRTKGEAVATAITYAIAVLAVSCPCGIGLAVPMVLVIANSIAARGGVRVKSAECTERSRTITDVVFDKTGTLTEQELVVVNSHFFDAKIADAYAITKALIEDSKHPVSVAVAKHLKPDIQPSPLVTDVHSIPGAGIEGHMAGAAVRAGNASFTRSEHLPEVRKMLEDGVSILMVMQDSNPIVCYGLQSRLRFDAVATVTKLREDGINVHLVSGDQNKAVQAIAAAVGIDRGNVLSQQTPEDKQAYVSALKAQGKVVMFCGDGTNDAVAVSEANIGVQITDSISSEVTQDAANVLTKRLGGILLLIKISRAAFVRTTFNFVWSAVYNVFAILLAAGAFVWVRIAPAYAGAGELVSILPIIASAMTMLLLNPRST